MDSNAVTRCSAFGRDLRRLEGVVEDDFLKSVSGSAEAAAVWMMCGKARESALKSAENRWGCPAKFGISSVSKPPAFLKRKASQ
jgi:hypothetical protein